MTEYERACREIANLKAHYFHCLDHKDFGGFDKLVADDAEIDFRNVTSSGDASAMPQIDGDAGLMTGSEFKAFLRDVVPGLVTVHQGYMPEFSDPGDGTMQCIWGMEDNVWFPEGSDPAYLHGWGHYHERYRREGDGWIIDRLRLTRLKVILSGTAP